MPAICARITAGSELEFDVLGKHSYLVRIFDLEKHRLFERLCWRVAANIAPVANYHPRGTTHGKRPKNVPLSEPRLRGAWEGAGSGDLLGINGLGTPFRRDGGRGQLRRIGDGGVVRQPAEDLYQIGFGVDVLFLAVGQQRVEQRVIRPSLEAAEEQPVVVTQLDRTDDVLDRVMPRPGLCRAAA